MKVSALLVVLTAVANASRTSREEEDVLVDKYLEGDAKALEKLWSDEGSFRARGSLFKRLARMADAEELFTKGIAKLTKDKSGRSIAKGTVKAFLDTLTADEIDSIGDINGGCTLLGPLLGALEPSALTELENRECILAMVKGAIKASPKGGEFVAALPDVWAEVPNVVATIHPVLNQATVAFLKKMAADSGLAKGMGDATVLNKMKQEQLEVFTSKFFSRIPGVGQADLRKALPLMADDILFHTASISAANLKALRLPQFLKLNMAHPKTACAQVPLSQATDVQLQNIGLPCIASFLASAKRAPIGRGWAHIRSDWTAGIKEEHAAALRGLADADKQHIPVPTWNNMLKSTAVCANMVGSGVFKATQLISAGPECLAKIRDVNLLKAILLNPDVEEDIFAAANSDFFRDLVVTIDKKKVVGLEILKYMKSPKKAEIVKSISTRYATGDHGCASVTSASLFHSISAELTEATAECLAEIRVTWRTDDLLKSPVLLGLYDMEDALKVLRGDWKNISAPVFAQLLKKGVLKDMTLETFNTINPAALSAITSEYLLQISFIEEVAAERMGKFAEKVFEAVDFAFFEKITFAKVSDLQLPHVSVAVSKPEDRVFAKLTAEQVKQFGARFSLLSALQLESVPADAFVVVTEEQFKALPAASLTNVTLEQMNKVDSKVRAKLSLEQAQSIGANVSDKSKSPLRAFTSIASSLDKNVRAVVETRANGAAALLPTSLGLAATLAAAILLF